MTEDKRLAALWKIADHIPELWGDECKDGYVNLNISADAIEAVQEAICQTPSDISQKPSDNKGLLDTLKYVKLNLTPLVEAAKATGNETCISQDLRKGGTDILEKIDEAISQAKEEN